MNINLHIERLILNGVNLQQGQRHLLQTSVTGELTRMLTEGGVSHRLAHGTDSSRIVTTGIQLTSNNPKQLGQQIAQSVYGGISND